MSLFGSAKAGASGPTQTAVQIAGLRADYGSGPVLEGIDLDVSHGEIVALLGPSGCGKTTLLRTIAGFIRPSEGTISVGGREVVGPDRWLEPQHRSVGLVPQEGALFPHLSVEANVAFGLKSASRSTRSTRVKECLALVGLPGVESRRPGELSGGQQQRVALARALAPQPSVILLDEPFSALDATLRAQVREQVREALRSAGATAILVTHDQEEALSFADRVAVVQHGRLAQVADPVTLYRHPTDLEVGTFVGESVELPGVTNGASVRCELGDLTRSVATSGAVQSASGHSASGAAEPTALPGSGDGDRVTVLLRPEQVEMVAAGSTTADAAVLSVTYYGHDALIRLKLVDSDTEVLSRSTRQEIPEIGSRHGLRVNGAVTTFANQPLHHLALAEDWEAAQHDDEYRVSTIDRTLEEEGFVHASFADQVRDTADAFYTGRDVVLLTIDPAAVGSEIKVESIPDGRRFPHIYGPVPLSAVTSAIPLDRDSEGRQILPENPDAKLAP